MSPPIFSVVMCNHNYAEYLEDAVGSVLSQDFEDFELIIVDDGSDDESSEIIEHFSDARIIPVFKKNGGQASALNEGFAVARGEFVAFLDSDDYWYRSKLRTLNEILSTEAVVAVQHTLELVDGSSTPLGAFHPACPKRDGVSDVLSWVTRHHSYPVGAPTSALAFTRASLLRIFPLSLGWRYCADIPLRLTFLLGHIWDCSTVLGAYRTHDKNGWWNTEGLERKRVQVMDDAQTALVDFLTTNGCRFRPVRYLSDSFYGDFRLHHGLQASRGFRVLQKLARVLHRRLHPLDLEAERNRLYVGTCNGETSSAERS